MIAVASGTTDASVSSARWGRRADEDDDDEDEDEEEEEDEEYDEVGELDKVDSVTRIRFERSPKSTAYLWLGARLRRSGGMNCAPAGATGIGSGGLISARATAEATSVS